MPPALAGGCFLAKLSGLIVLLICVKTGNGQRILTLLALVMDFFVILRYSDSIKNTGGMDYEYGRTQKDLREG